MPKMESGNEGQTDGRTLKRKFLNEGYNIIPALFKVAGYKKNAVPNVNQNIQVNHIEHIPVSTEALNFSLREIMSLCVPTINFLLKRSN